MHQTLFHEISIVCAQLMPHICPLFSKLCSMRKTIRVKVAKGILLRQWLEEHKVWKLHQKQSWFLYKKLHILNKKSVAKTSMCSLWREVGGKQSKTQVINHCHAVKMIKFTVREVRCSDDWLQHPFQLKVTPRSELIAYYCGCRIQTNGLGI